jgi:hypothetical protein
VESKPRLKADDPALRFSNKKAQMYQRLADLLERDEIDGLVDDTTIAQLSGILYETDSHGRMMLESKEKARQRGASSSDRAEALMLALGIPIQVIEFRTSSDLSDPNSPFYDGSDDDDLPFARRRWDVLAGNFRWGRIKGVW